MPSIANTAEGLSDGTVPTTANTGGTSGDSCSLVAIGAASTIQAKTAAAIHGSVGYRFTLAASGTDGAHRLLWNLSDTGRVAVSTYWRYSGTLTQLEDLMGIRHSSGNMGILCIAADGRLQMLNSAGSGITASKATNPLVFDGRTYRIEMAATRGTTSSNGTLEWAYFDVAASDTTPVQTWSSSVENTTINNVAAVFVGRSVGRTEAHTFDYDDIRASTLASGWMAAITTSSVQAIGSQTRAAIIDYSASSGTSLTISIAPTSGETSTPVSISTGKWWVPLPVSANAVYTVTVTNGTNTDTETVTVTPASSGTLRYYTGTGWISL